MAIRVVPLKNSVPKLGQCYTGLRTPAMPSYDFNGEFVEPLPDVGVQAELICRAPMHSAPDFIAGKEKAFSITGIRKIRTELGNTDPKLWK